MSNRSCVAQKQLIRQQVSQFILENPQISVQKSVEYLKKLTVVAISSISYLRNIFPDSAFSERKLEEVKLRILKGSDDIPGTKTMISWIKSAFSAVESHFLKRMILVIEKNNDDATLEIYTFHFTYKQEAIACHIQNEQNGQEILMERSLDVPADIMKATRQLIRSVLLLTTTMEPLPDDCKVSMRLEFNDSVPDDYNLPIHFRPVESLGISFPPDAQTLKLGKVETKFTTFTVSSKSVIKVNEEPCNNEEGEDEVVLSSQSIPGPSLSFVSPAPKNSETSAAAVPDAETSNLSETLSSVNLRDKVINCICECFDEAAQIIKCNVCSTFQHKACYKILEDQQVDRHVCVQCHDPNNPDKTCTDLDLVNDNNKKDGALYRRALVVCLSTFRVSLRTFTNNLNVNRQTALQIFNRLDIDGCLRPSTGKGNIRPVKIDHLKDNILSLYFNMPSNNSGITYMDTEENMFLRNINKNNTTGRKRNLNQDEGKESLSNPLPQQKRLKCANTLAEVKVTNYRLNSLMDF